MGDIKIKFDMPFSEENCRLIEKVNTVPGYVVGRRLRKFRKKIHPDRINSYTKVGNHKHRTIEAPRFEENNDSNVHNVKVIDYNESPFYERMHVRSGNKSHKQRSQLKAAPFDGQCNNNFTRLESFKEWPLESSTSAILLVKAGFSCINASIEKCECLSCGLTIVCTELEGRSALAMHKAKSPTCDFLQRLRPDSQMPPNRQPAASLDVDDAHTGDLYTDDNNHRASNNDMFEIAGTASQSHIDAPHGSQTKKPNTDVTPGCFQNDFSQPQAAQPYAAVLYPARNPDRASEQRRRETFMYWPHQCRMDVDVLVDAGFFFTGSDDIVRCFHCDIGLAEWNADDDPWIEHARHSPDCPYLTKIKTKSFIDQVQQEWGKVYTPKRPELTQLESRLKTFQNSSWPSDLVCQTPRQIAEAGFYYIGDGDTVRCHYCDGGLREWEPSDDPWVEHAKWFPFCKFVLKVKGIQFIQNSATGNETNTQSTPAPAMPSAYNSEGQKMSYEDECRKKEQANLLLTAAAQSIKEMGYNKSVIKFAINEHIGRTGRRNFNAEDLMKIIFEKEDSGELWSHDEDSQSQATGCQGDEASSDEEVELSNNSHVRDLDCRRHGQQIDIARDTAVSKNKNANISAMRNIFITAIKGLLNLTVSDLHDLGIEQECLVMARCQSVNYDRGMHVCYLNDKYSSLIPQERIDKDDHVFLDMSALQNEEMTGECAEIACPLHEKCVISNGSCVPSDCPAPPSKGDALISDGGSLIGDQRYYSCTDGYTAKWDRVITCGADGKWDTINLECTFAGNQSTSGERCTYNRYCSDKIPGSVCQDGVCKCLPDAEFRSNECITDCKSIYDHNKSARDGIYEVSPDGIRKVNVSCDMSGGGWTLIQTREATTEVNFNRPYKDYINTFGDLSGDHWIGLENIRLLTSANSNLKLDAVTINSDKGQAIFYNFTVGGPKEYYKLFVESNFQASGALSYIVDHTFVNKNGRPFSTIDQDMDEADDRNCAKKNGAFWHKHCCKLCNINKSPKNITVLQKDKRGNLILTKVTFKVRRTS